MRDSEIEFASEVDDVEEGTREIDCRPRSSFVRYGPVTAMAVLAALMGLDFVSQSVGSTFSRLFGATSEASAARPGGPGTLAKAPTVVADSGEARGLAFAGGESTSPITGSAPRKSSGGTSGAGDDSSPEPPPAANPPAIVPIGSVPSDPVPETLDLLGALVPSDFDPILADLGGGADGLLANGMDAVAGVEGSATALVDSTLSGATASLGDATSSLGDATSTLTDTTLAVADDLTGALGDTLGSSTVGDLGDSVTGDLGGLTGDLGDSVAGDLGGLAGDLGDSVTGDITNLNDALPADVGPVGDVTGSLGLP